VWLPIRIQTIRILSCPGKFVSRDEGATRNLRRAHKDNGRAGMYKPCIEFNDWQQGNLWRGCKEEQSAVNLKEQDFG